MEPLHAGGGIPYRPHPAAVTQLVTSVKKEMLYKFCCFFRLPINKITQKVVVECS